jgi:hypothetical protein
MAGIFFTMQEVVDKLSKSEEQIHELIQEGKLREFRDGTKLLFKVSEVESLESQLPITAAGEPVEILPNDSEVVLEPIAGPSAAAAPTPSVPELDIVEDAPLELADDDEDDELLLGDISLDDTQDGLQDNIFADSGTPVEELSLEDSLNFLAGDSGAEEVLEIEEASLESDELLTGDDDDLLLADDSIGGLLEEDEPLEDITIEDAIKDITEEPAVELPADDTEVAEELSLEPEAEITSDDSMDLLLTDDSPEEEVTEELSLEETSDGEDALIMSDESSADILLDDGDSLKLAETSAGIEEKAEEDDFDLGDSFDMLMDDDSDDGASIDKDGSLLSDDTLGGLLSPDSSPAGSDDELLSSLTKADTAMGNTGINILAESDGDFQLASDTKADTVLAFDDDDDDSLDDLDDLDMSDGDFLSESAGLGDLDDDLNLDSIGSGSGLLDLSLQADDTSLGAVLDDILPSEEEIETAPVELDEGTILDDPEKIFEADGDDQMMQSPAAGGQIAVRYAEAPPTAVENACGIAMFLPAIMVAYAAIVLLFGLKGISPALMTQTSAEMAGLPIILWVVIGASVLFLVILMFAALLGGGSGEKKAKTKKAGKPKKAKKAKKPKKAKKAKKKK